MDQQYTHRLEKIESVLERWLPLNPGPDWGREVFPGITPQLLQALVSPGKDLLSRGGKRWRPLLMTLVCEALGGGDAALPLVPLVEFCHNASLIHDDIEDNSDERRGKPAVHIIHGVDVAINSGSFLYFLPLACIDSWAADPYCKLKIYSLWAAYLRKLHLGQAMDIHWHRNFEAIPSLDEYFTMCKLKTGCLARFAAELGAVVAEMNSTISVPIESLYAAAEKLGVGFQILDDVKNVTTGIPGKKRGDDIVEGKKSLPVLLFLNRQPEKMEMVFRCFNAARSGGVGVPEVEELIQALAAAGVFAEAEAQAKTLVAEAREAFAGFALLGGLVDIIV
ncbi:MAG: polyprenyl synthetase family protein [Treponema sp.]|jgi:octaprenyl-diphosphate synthase|nr:polyprenyl synthetase family protein [Treponema sp.]